MRKCLKKGFTLVELLVVLMLMGLITTAVVMALKPVTQIYADINYKADEETGSITLFDFLNGDLRYATKVEIISSDSTTLPNTNHKSFIVLSNTTRPNSNKGARGYAMYGKTDDPSNKRYCVSESILAENDFQFSIESYNDSPRQQSFTIEALAHPMKENQARNGFEVNTQKPYTYREAVQFVNMRYVGQLSTSDVGFSCNYDSSKPYIWILYDKPSDLASNTSVVVTGNTDFAKPDSSKKGPLTVNYGAQTAKLTVIVQNGATVNVQSGHYKVKTTGCIMIDPGGNNDKTEYDNFGNNKKCEITYEVDTAETKIYANSTEIWNLPYQKLVNDYGGSLTVYVYDDAVHLNKYVAPGTYTNPKELRVHYIAQEEEDSNLGVQLRANGSVSSGIEVRYDDNGVPITEYLGDWDRVFVKANGQDKDFTVYYLMDGTKADLYWTTGQWGEEKAHFQEIKDTDIGANEGAVKEVWLYAGVLYTDYSQVPYTSTEKVYKDKMVHFIFNPEQPSYAGLTFADKDDMSKSSSTNYGDIPDNGTFDINANAQSLDVKVTIIKKDGKVEVRNYQQNYEVTTLDENSPDEIWIYNGTRYDSPDSLPGYRTINETKTIHYLAGNNSYTDGIVLTDADNYKGTAKAGSDSIPDNGSLFYTLNGDADIQVTLITDGARVDVAAKAAGSNGYYGSTICTMEEGSPAEIWIYNGVLYNDKDSAEAQRTYDQENGVVQDDNDQEAPGANTLKLNLNRSGGITQYQIAVVDANGGNWVDIGSVYDETASLTYDLSNYPSDRYVVIYCKSNGADQQVSGAYAGVLWNPAFLIPLADMSNGLTFTINGTEGKVG